MVSRVSSSLPSHVTPLCSRAPGTPLETTGSPSGVEIAISRAIESGDTPAVRSASALALNSVAGSLDDFATSSAMLYVSARLISSPSAPTLARIPPLGAPSARPIASENCHACGSMVTNPFLLWKLRLPGPSLTSTFAPANPPRVGSNVAPVTRVSVRAARGMAPAFARAWRS